MRKSILIFSYFFLCLSPLALAASFDSSSGKVNWQGEMIGGETHKGTIGIKSGEFDLKSGQGEIIIDMLKIKPEGMSQDRAIRLTQHLETKDFFDAYTHPTAKLKILSVKPEDPKKNLYKVSADLTIRGKSAPNTFLATIREEGKSLAIEGETSFDRSLYEQSYQLEESSGIAEKTVKAVEAGVANIKKSIIRNQIKISFQLKSK